NTFLDRWVVYDMICPSTSRTCSPSGKTFNQILFRNIYIQHMIKCCLKLCQYLFQCLRLSNCPWEAIEQEALLTVFLLQSFLNNPDSDFIWNKFTLIHI